MTDRYLRFANGVQALRRHVEGLSMARGGALGVAADPMPWQLATIERILGDIEIRHLISDEVGLGKTVQALMIINALRWQAPGHRTVIVTPEHLLPQWQEECWIRGHVAPAISGTGLEGIPSEAPILLVRPQDIGRGSETDGPGFLDPMTQDLLIVDEPQTMALEVMETIASRAGDYRQVLVLSATPRLGEPRWRDIVMRMIEPQMAARAAHENRSIDEVLADREDAALLALAGDDLPPEAGARAFRAAAAGRRIIRNSRADWGSYLPARRNVEIRVPAIGNERRMHEMAARLLEGTNPDGDLRAQPWAPARGLQRSARTARPILASIAERGGELGFEAAQLRQALTDDPGDTRLEALLDLLSAQWERQPDRTFIIVCGDNPTIDLLLAALPRYFPDLQENISVLRRQSAREEDTVVSMKEMLATLAPLLAGEHQLLLVGDWVQAGLNLHHVAVDIVFYSLPWDIVSIDQLIGRVDRLRSGAVRRKTQNREVSIWRITQHGSQEAAVSDVLERMGLFAVPLPPLSERELGNLSAIVAQAAISRAAPAALPQLSERGAGVASLMTGLDPWTLERTRAGYAAWQQLGIPAPAMIRAGLDNRPLRQGEDALKSWLDMMARSADFDFARRSDVEDPNLGFHTLWYARLAGKNMAGPAPFDLPDTERNHWMENHQPIIISRRHLPVPPRISVQTDGGEATRRPLRFLDHGEPLHDALVAGYTARATEAFGRGRPVQSVTVRLPEGHPALAIGRQILVTACLRDPFPDSWLPPLWSDAARDLQEQATSDTQKQQLLADRKRLQSRLRGLQRLVRLHRPAALHLLGHRFEGGDWVPLAQDLIEAALKPLLQDGERYLWAREAPGSMQTVATGDIKRGHEIQLRELSRLLNSAMTTDREALQQVVVDCRAQVTEDSTAFVRIRTEEARRRRGLIRANSMRHALEGQAVALERSARMAEICAMEEVMLIERFRTGPMPAHAPIPISICLAFVAAV